MSIDQIEDLLRRLAKCDLETCEVVDPDGNGAGDLIRCPVGTIISTLLLSTNISCQSGTTSIQVMWKIAGRPDSSGPDRSTVIVRSW